MEEFKQIQRAVWDSGDYASLSSHIADMGRRVVAAAGVEAGTDVLDVACGTGNAAFPAARAGARVTGLDLAPSLLAVGRAQAEEEGLDIDWVDGDAEDLPFADGSFDCVLSTVGHMFAPRHQRTADEMARVCRPGGVLAFACWTPDGNVGQLFKETAAFQPPPPPFASPPVLWGTEQHVRELFGSAARDFEFSYHSATIDYDSLGAWADLFMERFPPMVAAHNRLGDERFEEMRERIVELWRSQNTSDNGRFVLPQEYLLSVVRL